MARRSVDRGWFGRITESSPTNVGALGFKAAGGRERLSVPDWVDSGDTPAGNPAIWWVEPPLQNGIPIWSDGDTPDKAFRSFIKLADEEKTEKFVDFAKRFGPLGLWEFRDAQNESVLGEPEFWVPCHSEGILTPHRFLPSTLPSDVCADRRSELARIRYEPMSEWRRWAAAFRSTLRIAVRLRNNELGRFDDWRQLGYEGLFDGTEKTEQFRDIAFSVTTQQELLSYYVERKFLVWAGLQPMVIWSDHGPRYSLGYRGENQYAFLLRSSPPWPMNCLFPSLVLQLLTLISAGNLATCDDCGSQHARTRAARADQPVRCLECRLRAERRSKAESARRQRAAGRTN